MHEIGGWKSKEYFVQNMGKIRILSDISNIFENKLINFLEAFRFSKCSVARQNETGFQNNNHKNENRMTHS
jgi:hypothetical protein